MIQMMKSINFLRLIILSAHVWSSPAQNNPKIVLKKLEMNVLNGKTANIRDLPHAAFLMANCDGMLFSCTGSLVFPYLVLTAGHCVSPCVGDENYSITVTVGSSFVSEGTNVKAIEVILHEGYDADTAENDISMIVLQKLLKRTEKVNFINMPYYGFQKPKFVLTAGWGAISKEGVPSARLLSCTERVKNFQSCEGLIQLTELHFCSVFSENNCETLIGDSGSAVTTLDRKYQVGIVSYGDENDTVSVFVNISLYLNWIVKKHTEYASRIVFIRNSGKTEVIGAKLLFKSLNNITDHKIQALPGMMKAVVVKN